jgi:hypothetical protein
MTPLQSFWPRWSYNLPIGRHDHYHRRCVYKHTDSILNWILGKRIEHAPSTRHLDIMAGLSTCADVIPIASDPTRSGLASTTLTLSESITSPTHWAWKGGCG